MKTQGVWVDGERTRALIKQSGLSVPKFAKKVKLSPTTVRNAMRGAKMSESAVNQIESKLRTSIRCGESTVCGGIDFDKIESMFEKKGINPNDFFAKKLGKSIYYWRDLKQGKVRKEISEEILYILSSLLECKKEDLYIKVEPPKKEDITETQKINANMGVANYLINLKIMIEEMSRELKSVQQDVRDLKDVVASFDVRVVRPFALLDNKIDKILDEFEIGK